MVPGGLVTLARARRPLRPPGAPTSGGVLATARGAGGSRWWRAPVPPHLSADPGAEQSAAAPDASSLLTSLVFDSEM
ncbi:hypothetical protein AV530_011964 [Patagioenas fasciata monilis]|uniref:Uncharacterized protein n=1 Tax=Patagioenas fasciata monilis TaxID=372326 RepID=A0A1V4JUH1_PATFA|nr:hypothetical protein AV530_011964 [Patagioenas fasciata monilis]